MLSLTPLSRSHPLPITPANGRHSQQVNTYDGRQMDTSTPEGQIHVSNYLSVVMSPAFAFMRIVGIYHITMIKSLKAALIIYNLLIIAVQCIATFRRITLVQLNVLTVQTAAALISAIYLCSGTLASMYLFRIGPHLHEIHLTVMREMAQYDRGMNEARKIRIFSAVLVLFVIAVCMLIVASNAVLLMGFDEVLYLSPLFTKQSLVIDLYVLFVGECAIMMCAAIFIICCHVLSRSTQVLVKHMKHECIESNGTSADEAIQRVGYFQDRFQSLRDAVNVVNSQFSYVHFCVVVISVPMLCFNLYVAFQQRCDSRLTWLEIATLAFWSVHILFLFLLFTIPAVKLLEESAEIANTAFRIYNNLMVEKQNYALISIIEFFATRVNASPFSFTAGGFFTITRGIILTLLSATFSYFLILRGFSSDPDCGTHR